MAGFMKKMFRGMETPAEEKKEAKALKSGAISKKQYVAGEKSEGHGAGAAKKAAAIKSGKLSPAKYAAEHKEKAMKCGGKVKRMMFGGIANAVGTAAQKADAMSKLSSMGIKPSAAAMAQADKMNAAARQAAAAGKQQAVARQAAAGGKPATPSMAGGATAAGPAKGSVGLTGGPKPSPIRNQPIRSAPVGGKPAMPAVRKAKGGGVEAKGKTAGKAVKMAKGGSARGCGIAVKGKTKGKMV